jgi:DNA-binding MarR family transcriptional regulator/N-acetylglutamate synthase-like GNAT family acetyltransferase
MELQTRSHDVAAVRRFNRFYTRQLGLLDRSLLNSGFSLVEARILYELAHRDSLTAADLRRQLDVDAGYLSRLLKKLERHGLLSRSKSPLDGRASLLSLTPAGRAVFEPLDAASQQQVAGMIASLRQDDTEDLVRSMRTMERVLERRAPAADAVTFRPLQVGDIGWIAHRQGLLYSREYGWDGNFEALVARIAADFVTSFDPERERCWVAEWEGEVVGSAFLVKQSDEVAKLRLLYVEPAARHIGIGRRLVAGCISFAKEKGYRKLVLWTNDVLVSARHIYQAEGFRLVAEEPHHSFGKDLVGQNWELLL